MTAGLPGRGVSSWLLAFRKTLLDLDHTNKLLTRDIVAIDLRLPDRVTVRQSDGAAAAREQAFKDAEKAKKGKAGKGGEA